MHRLNTPLPWMLGSLAATSVAAISGAPTRARASLAGSHFRSG